MSVRIKHSMCLGDKTEFTSNIFKYSESSIVVSKETGNVERVFIRDENIVVLFEENEISIGDNIIDIKELLKDIYCEKKNMTLEYYFSKKDSPFVNDILRIKYLDNRITEMELILESDFI